ncbi:MOSC domain-containing protein [Nakamurella aerolata]|uniref:MOSC domain-containing protein n=1 Tax=Nakamurella aerolata TaxID=1656892 RepID=A0A849AI00_9ACTN|nr:MOSC N-terminal beta barrel domain-containing protein [Nakamurella aerolata]NNG36452.1 MOSC domain-containing protein [Nakamurella aerolata]
MEITALNLHPVKSTAIRPVRVAEVGTAGLVGDREWMVVDDAGQAITARELPTLMRIVADTPQTDPDCQVPLRLSAPGIETLELAAAAAAEPLTVRMFTRPTWQALRVADAADAWLGEVLQRTDVHLVHCHRPEQRELGPEHSRPGDHAAFQDGYPVTVIGAASVRQLDDWVAERRLELGEAESPGTGSILPQRFRANIVVSGAEPFDEDDWTMLQIGEVRLRGVKSVDRCVMTTIDPTTLQKGKEPIRTLARYRRWDGKTWIARHLIPDRLGRLSVGDRVEVTERAAGAVSVG